MKKAIFTMAVILVVLLTACNSKPKEKDQITTKENSTEKTTTEQNQKLSGNYVCTEHWNSDLIGGAVISFDKDSVNFSGIGKTTYRIKGDSLFIDMHSYEMAFAIVGNTLKATGGAGTVAYTKK